MIEIYIDNKLVDLDNTNISLQKEFEDAVENIPTEIEYSYTISIPASLNNKEIFGFTDTFDVPNKFKRLYDADLYVDEVLVLKGKFKVTSIEGGYYKGNIYNPKKKTISDILGDKKLNEIISHPKMMNSLSDFDKLNNWLFGLSKKDERLPDASGGEDHDLWNNDGVLDNHVVYPYILYGLPMHNIDNIPVDQDIYTQDLEYGKHNINEDNIFPAFNVISVLKDMFKTEGYNLTGNIIDGNLKDLFGNLYQTFQYQYDDYVKNKEIPFYCRIKGGYYNYCLSEDQSASILGASKYNPSSTIEVMNIWDSPTWRTRHGDDKTECDGSFKYGVDNPWTVGSRDQYHIFGSIYKKEDEKHMFTPTSSDSNAGIFIIPKSGWYRIKLSGNMKYPFKGSEFLTGIKQYFPLAGHIENGDPIIGGCVNEADNTTLAEQPFEIQLKKGDPKSSPKLYSFNWFTPNNAVEYYEDKTVAMDTGGDTWVKIPEGENQRRFAKNNDVTLIKNIGDYSTDDFICGARLGGAWFSAQWYPAYYGDFRRKNRFYAQGAGLTLPDVTKSIRVKHFENEEVPRPYKTKEETKKFDGYFMKVCDKDTNQVYEYGTRTAQCMARKDNAYTNFKGYNTLVGSEGNYSWDTTSNYGATSWEGASDCSASTYNAFGGEWDVNTVVWLNQGDELYLELLIPMNHYGTEYCCHSKWIDRHEVINAVDVFYDLFVGYLNNDSEWKPMPDNGIKDWNELKKHKLTNVNQFLPEVTCNDYLEKFLKTFNLQLTMKDSKTFSIDSLNGGNLMGNVIDIDGLCNIEDAEFKPLKSDSVLEYKWKIDQGETGYAQGNGSPYRNTHGESPSDSPYYDSGYTGEQILENDANSSGSIKKIEAPWSYNWYKTIHFLHNAEYPPITEEWADISVISDTDLWKNGMTFGATAGDKPKTSKTMRLFTLKKNREMLDKKYSYISFKYDEQEKADGGGSPLTHKEDLFCNLVLPSNYWETPLLSAPGSQQQYNKIHLDYKIMNKANDKSLMDLFFNKNVQGGYDIEVPIKLSNEQYTNTKQGTLYKLNDGLYKVKSIEGWDVNKKDDARLTLTTLK